MIRFMGDYYGKLFSDAYGWETISNASCCENIFRFVPILTLITAIGTTCIMFPDVLVPKLRTLWKEGGTTDGYQAHCDMSFIIINLTFMVLGLSILLFLITNLVILGRKLYKRLR